MIPDPYTVAAKGQVPIYSKTTAYEYHNTLLSMLFLRGTHLTKAITKEQVRQLKEHAYRGSDLRYSSQINRGID